MFETTGVTPAGRISTHDLGLWKDEQIPAFISLVSSLRTLSPGLTVGVQLGHAGRKSSTFPPFQRRPRKHEEWAEEEEGGWPEEIVAPSAVPYGPNWFKPRELSISEIEDIQQQFIQAAERAYDKVGVDFIEIHLAHGYLGHQFLSPLSNKRTDQYGGSFEGRTKFSLDVIKAIRARWPERSLWVRISATDQCDHLAAQGTEVWDLEQTKKLAEILDREGVAVLDVSSGGLVAEQQIQVGHAYQAPLAAGIKSLNLPSMKVMSVGMLESGPNDKAGEVAEATLQNGHADLIAIARGQMASPNWTELAAANLAGVRTVENPSYHRIHGPKRTPH
ncbi:NADH:flavin oxidoreductase/12-oxophytodienoate reductase [Ceraceosorus bombacis]|uniref:NADH:flavin oxidoreductase/12-oxophytodienoate reductase n=1 Tax=Ceraceosorus bombacis TaxID=401625 RepID=A0A0P1BFW9_9BASI|nr:NADH:flavin oxidoreductase/12-oxophytodienoate reductase [Ceraceosorus bombacis]